MNDMLLLKHLNGNAMRNNLKIFVVCQHFYPETFRINDICFELVKRGHSVTVLTGFPNYPKGIIFDEYRGFKIRKEDIKGVNVERAFLIERGKGLLSMALNYASFAIFASIKALWLRKDYDVIFSYQLSPVTMVWPAIVMKWLIKKPLIIHCLDQWPISVTTGPIKKSSFIYKFLTKLSVWTYKQANLITISSKSFAKYFKEDLGIDKKYIYWPSYAESEYEGIKFKKDKYFDIVFAGNIGPAQSVETIILTANELREMKDIRFHIVGDGLSRNDCESLAKKLGLDNVKFYGFYPVEEMPNFYSSADAFMITMADNEVVNQTLPAKLQSYMLAGKPILGAINGEVKDVVEEAECGACSASLDYVGLANLIKKHYKNQALLEKWSNNSKKYYEKHFNKEKSLLNFEDILYNIKNKIED
ncbi:MAG TPA: glycosyltransferase family 4 protein [Candidatus Woesebacteria bacterium]|nr:glycosyltransferase family 4 protein [Candidatus Woesebacteria bacterium]